MAGGISGTIHDTQGLKNVSGDTIPTFTMLTDNLYSQTHSTVIKKRDWTGWVGFKLGDITLGILGTSTLGGAATPALVLDQVVNPNNIWKEALRNTDFEDSVNTTGTWDTTNHKLTFTTGQQIQTSIIAKKTAINITNAEVRFDESRIVNKANLTYWLSSDGGTTFEQVNNYIKHYFTTIGTELVLKIVLTTGTSAEIQIELFEAGFLLGTSLLGTGFLGVTDTDLSQPLQVAYNQ